MNVLAIDPGNEESGVVVLSTTPNKDILYKNKILNLELIKALPELIRVYDVKRVGIETVSSYGMPVGQNTFDTCIWIGILIEKLKGLGVLSRLVFRKSIKMHFCGSVRATDSNIRQALVNRFGEDNTKKNPNPFYVSDGASWMNGDIWAALGLAVYLTEPHDIPLKNEAEMEKNKLSQSLLKYAYV